MLRQMRGGSSVVCFKPMRFERLEPRIVLSGSGLTGQYFHNADHTGLAVERIEAVDFNWGAGSPAPGIDADSFSMRWIGQIEAKFSETYTLRTVSDEGVRLWIDGQLLIDNWNPHSLRTDSANIALVAGPRYDIHLEYYEGSGQARMQLLWSSASQSLEIVPATQLYASPPGLWGEYSDAIGGQARRIDEAVAFDWGADSPAAGVAADNFHVCWSGYLRADYSEWYTFTALADDGVRLWIGDQLVIDNWDAASPGGELGEKTLEAGKWYGIRLEYFEGVGTADVMLQWSGDRQTGGAFETLDNGNLRAAKHAPITFQNPLGPGADPYVAQWEGSYLLVRSSFHSIWIDQADQLQDIHASTPESISALVWTAPGGTTYSEQLWAPELHRIDDKWYIYVAASDGNNATHRMHVLERDSADPMGPFAYKGQLATPVFNRWAIDGTVLPWQGRLYFVWSGWPGTSDGQQNLYIAEMLNPWTLKTGRVLLSSPDFAWEQHGLPINEGPQILIHDGQLHIIYSASGYWTHEYSLGRITYNGTGNLLSQASWTKSNTPVFQAAGEVVGTGHASFTKSPDGTQDWIVYHAHHDANNWQDDRDVRIQPFEFFSDGTPNFGDPLPSTAVLEAPSGHAAADRPLLLGDYNANGVVDAGDYDVLVATFDQILFPGSGADGNGNGIVDAADITVWGDNEGRQATAPLSKALQAPAASRVAIDTLAIPAANVAAVHEEAVTTRRAAIDMLHTLAPFAAWAGRTSRGPRDEAIGGNSPRAVDRSLRTLADDRYAYRTDARDGSHWMVPSAKMLGVDRHNAKRPGPAELCKPPPSMKFERIFEDGVVDAVWDAWGADGWHAGIFTHGVAT